MLLTFILHKENIGALLSGLVLFGILSIPFMFLLIFIFVRLEEKLQL